MAIMMIKQVNKLLGMLWRISELYRNRRVISAYKIGVSWVMPVGTEIPKDSRVIT